HAHHATGTDRGGLEMQRRVALVGGAGDVGAELAQRVDEVADRALVHARHARQAVLAARQRERRGERPEGGAGVAEEEIAGLDREGAADAAYTVVQAVALAPP